MSLPPALESEFELVEELPTGKAFQCYHVKDMRKGGIEAVVRLLPENFAVDQSTVNRFHDFFSRFNDIPNRRYIPSVYSVVGVPGKDVYVVEEYCPGVSLAQFMEKNSGLQTFIMDITAILTRVCEGLHHAHQKSIYHLCILPSDILIYDQDCSKVKLVGFGAQIFAEKGKIDYLSSQSSRFVAPEVFKRGVFGPKADVYSLAVMIKELLPEFSEASDILNKATSVTLKDRFSSARQFAANIKELSIADPATEPAPKVIQPDSPKGGLHLVLKIKTDPEGAEIWSNDNKLGITSASGLMAPWKPGTILEIKKTGYSTETLDLSTPPENTDINVKLQSSLILYTNPWGASVLVDGKQIGITDRDGLMVPWDGATIEIQKSGYKSEILKLDSLPRQNESSIELNPAVSTDAPKRHILEVIGYVIGAIVLWLLPLVIYSATVNRSGLEKDIGDKDREITRLTQAEKALRIDFDKQVSAFRSQVKTKDTEIERLAQAEKNLKIDADKQLLGLRSELSNKAAEIAKLTHLDQEKSRSQAELQKQLNDLKSTILTKDRDIAKLSQVERENKQLQAQLKSLKQSSSQPPQSPMPPSTAARAINHNLDMELISAASAGDDKKVRSLLTQGANPSALNIAGHTALMMACANGHLEVVKSLLVLGADKNQKSSLGSTALDFAARYEHPSIVSLLNTQGGGSSPARSLPSAKTSNDNLDMELISAVSNGNSHEVSRILAQGAAPNSRNSDGYTALMIASKNGDIELVKTLLKSGVDKNLKSPSGKTALDWANHYKRDDVVYLLTQRGDMELVSACSVGDSHAVAWLLDKGYDPNARNSEGHTALMKASMNGHLNVVNTLLKSGADKNLKSPSGNTALDYAKLYNHTSLFDYLR